MNKILKTILLLLTAAVLTAGASACGRNKNAGGGGQAPRALKVVIAKAAAEEEFWKSAKDEFQNKHPGVTVTIERVTSPEGLIEDAVLAGQGTPDVLLLPVGRSARLTERYIADRALHGLTGLLDRNVYGESVTLKEKLLPGFLDTLASNPYQGTHLPDRTAYMLPYGVSPRGLLYNGAYVDADGAGGKLRLPSDFGAFLNLRQNVGEKGEAGTLNAAATGPADLIYLFGYAAIADAESFITATVATYAGQSAAEKLLSYEPVWTDPDQGSTKIHSAFKELGRINKKFTGDASAQEDVGKFVYNTDGRENDGALKNIEAFLNGRIIFMPGGIESLIGALDEKPGDNDANKIKKAELKQKLAAFDLGFTPYFKGGADGQRYTAVESRQIYIPKASQNKALAEDFLLWLFSDSVAAKYSLNGFAVTPTQNALDSLAVSAETDKHRKTVFASAFSGGARPLHYKFAKLALAVTEGNWSTAYLGKFVPTLKGENSSNWIEALEINGARCRADILTQN
ncbi:MAG: extracellular solute-binding protein [Clostridiales bacterium]|jgi:N-acetylglucosamine transport system substrate-binding protein|nr:extracellular solute-binding protein [Clostridiales bacterium]